MLFFISQPLDEFMINRDEFRSRLSFLYFPNLFIKHCENCEYLLHETWFLEKKIVWRLRDTHVPPFVYGLFAFLDLFFISG